MFYSCYSQYSEDLKPNLYRLTQKVELNFAELHETNEKLGENSPVNEQV